jgi:hypothetical protein
MCNLGQKMNTVKPEFLKDQRRLRLVGDFDAEIFYVRSKRITSRARQQQLSSQAVFELGDRSQSVSCGGLVP